MLIMKILAIGDPHGNLDAMKKVPKDVDLILLTGDLGKADLMRKMAFNNARRESKGLKEKHYSASDEKEAYMEAYLSTIRIAKYLRNYTKIYTIFGNVERTNQRTRRLSKRIGVKLPFLEDNLKKIGVNVINNRQVKLKGITIGGLQYFLDHHSVIYLSYHEDISQRSLKERKRASDTLKKFGHVDILLCHQPPFGILDYADNKRVPEEFRGHVGSKIILDHVLKEKPKYVICGHIHEAKGYQKLGSSNIYNLGRAGHQMIIF